MRGLVLDQSQPGAPAAQLLREPVRTLPRRQSPQEPPSRPANASTVVTGEEFERGVKNVTKQEFVDQVGSRSGVGAKEAEQVLVAMFDTIADTLRAGDLVELDGLGTFDR